MDIPDTERKHVVDVYNKIAYDFSETRYKPWKEVINFVNNLPVNSSCLEVGCGNGKNLYRADINMYGVDVSENLVKIAVCKGKNAVVADGCNLPFESNNFDAVMSIAVFHHVSTLERRIKFLQEILRVCKIDGSIMIEVWTSDDPTYGKNKRISNFSDENNKDKIINFCSKTGKKVYGRYYHFFEDNEFQNLINTTVFENKSFQGQFTESCGNAIFIGNVRKIDL